jgi:predicted methyltransferase
MLARRVRQLGKGIGAAVVAAVIAGCATSPPAGPSAAERAKAVVASPIRTDQDRRMDASRNPLEFLPFTGVAPGMVVFDLSAGAGYTSQIMALSVGPTGKLYAQRPAPGEALTKRLADNPQPNFVVVYRPFADPIPPDAPKFDLITFVNNYHDFANTPIDRVALNRRLYDALKPGGHLVIVDHSALPGSGTSATRTLHRIDEAVVVAEVKQAGFVLEAEGQFLRHPDDARTVSSGDGAILTDKFALKFVRPR